VIDEGKIVCDDTPKVAVDSFKKVLTGNFYTKIIESDNSYKSDKLLRESFTQNKELDSYGNNKAIIIDYGIVDENSKPSSIINYNTKFKIIMKIKFCDKIEEPIFAFTIKDSKGLEITGTNTAMKHIFTQTYNDGDILTVIFEQNANFQLGKYALSLGCVALNENGIEVYNRLYDAILFEVIGSMQMVGFYDLGSKIDVIR